MEWLMRHKINRGCQKVGTDHLLYWADFHADFIVIEAISWEEPIMLFTVTAQPTGLQTVRRPFYFTEITFHTPKLSSPTVVSWVLIGEEMYFPQLSGSYYNNG